ncbi:GIY-YIG nuclease family protein [Deinococcus yavapaiensis]|uniref:GIY-YIG nuclease family protein n=1 Tax=Deinococcus yavapaiensis KR-236 TaxID=694435 RepID=A0A318S5G1_9DEIO|nr:GIY-YIG nuclease family protein [Deinococcus yavapaiensis]PYE49392.1 hypothetical protein DES52_12428 [Deinococcus yavapaiensis KR-236]
MTDFAPARRYKGFTPKAGVYRVTHLPSGRTLLGSSPHLDGMLNRIRFTLGMNGHRNSALQRDWNTDGEGAFRFEILDELTPDESGEVSPVDLAELLTLWEEKLSLPHDARYGATVAVS